MPPGALPLCLFESHPVRDELLNELLPRLKRDFGFSEKGDWLREGKCPECNAKKSLYTHADHPWVLRCGRLDSCGAEISVKQSYPDIFDDWSKRHKPTPEKPNAAADAYLRSARGFNLAPLAGCYTQEWYRDPDLNITSATVRFPLPGGGYWQRLIDQPGRFGDKKATFSPRSQHRGHCWLYPGDSFETLAQEREIWIAEGIFDAIALRQANIAAVSAMTCNIWPEHFLADLRKACADLDRPLPRIVWAFDQGAAGVEWSRRFAKQAREAGWPVGAAQVRVDGEGKKTDWNDLFQSDKLKPDDIEAYLWAGDVTIATSADEKAFLIYKKHRSASFPIIFNGRQLWATFSLERIEQHLEQLREADPSISNLPYPEQWELAARQSVDIAELANCTFRTLYFQRDTNMEEGAYYFRVDFPKTKGGPRKDPVKAPFSGSACSSSGEFKKRLAAVAPGAQWTGANYQLDKLMLRQWTDIQTVEAIQFTGYSIDHEGWLLGDLGVSKGKVAKINEDDYFIFSRKAVKLRTSDRLLSIKYDPDQLDISWTRDIYNAWGAKGLAVMTFWGLSLFAEQIRATQESLAFLEVTGPPGTGKTTLIAFLWKLMGRVGNYEGFDPTKATNAGIARTLGQVGNLPVVLIEGDRNQDTPHSRRFEWDELKTAYNGRAVRTRAIANGGMETFEPPFRGAIAIVQNDPVEASPALRERIMGLCITKDGWGPDTRKAAERINRYDRDQVSGFIVHVVRREAEILTRYRERFAIHYEQMLKQEGIRNDRLAKNHAQLAAMFDALRVVLTNIPDDVASEVQGLFRTMLAERQRLTENDHPHVELFWERFDYIQSLEGDTTLRPIDHSLNSGFIAVNLVQFEQRCGDLRLALPQINELKRVLRTSRTRKFIANKPVNSSHGKTVSCWVFERPAGFTSN
jgi:hypothetical protein